MFFIMELIKNQEFPLSILKGALITSPVSGEGRYIKDICVDIEDHEIIIVDDLVATGGTAIACAELFTEHFNISKSNILIVCVIDLPDLGGSNLIARRGYQIKTLMEF